MAVAPIVHGNPLALRCAIGFRAVVDYFERRWVFGGLGDQ